MSYRLDPSQQLKTIDLAWSEGAAAKSATRLGIYTFVSDKLLLAHARDEGLPRPTTFAAKDGDASRRNLILQRPSPLTPVGRWPRDLYPKLSPFSAVRWRSDIPDVLVDGAWYELLKIDDVPVFDLMAYWAKAAPRQLQTRFEEDLGELLSRVGHEPGDRVDLVVRTLDAKQTRTLKNVPMTEQNLQAIRKASQEREDAKKQPRPNGEATKANPGDGASTPPDVRRVDRAHAEGLAEWFRTLR
jgi:hypothetical protein